MYGAHLCQGVWVGGHVLSFHSPGGQGGAVSVKEPAGKGGQEAGTGRALRSRGSGGGASLGCGYLIGEASPFQPQETLAEEE